MSDQIQTAATPDGATNVPPPAVTIAKSDQIFQTSRKLATNGHENGRSANNVEFGVLRQVQMTVQVEVGRTSMTLGEVLDELEVGSSIRLDRHAGDPVEVYINGALFARAEVVVLQDQIGARIVELVDPAQNSRPSGLR